MTLDETINEAKITATLYEKEARKCIQYGSLFYEEKAKAFSESAKEFEQIAEWLEELKTYREADRPQGEWIKMPHKKYLPWDCVGEYENPTYDEKYHSVVEWWWHCNKCFYKMSRDGKPSYNFCPNCGARMKGVNNE